MNHLVVAIVGRVGHWQPLNLVQMCYGMNDFSDKLWHSMMFGWPNFVLIQFLTVHDRPNQQVYWKNFSNFYKLWLLGYWIFGDFLNFWDFLEFWVTFAKSSAFQFKKNNQQMCWFCVSKSVKSRGNMTKNDEIAWLPIWQVEFYGSFMKLKKPSLTVQCTTVCYLTEKSDLTWILDPFLKRFLQSPDMHGFRGHAH